MSFIYITGAPGVGKSTIQRGLSDLGYEAYDIDSPDLGGPYNLESGERVQIPPAESRPNDWFDHHEWRIDIDALRKLKETASTLNAPLYLCGVAPSDEQILPLFDKIAYLQIDNDNLVHRLLHRIDNDFGKNDAEISMIIKRKVQLDYRYASSNVICIDASRPLDAVIRNIIQATT